MKGTGTQGFSLAELLTVIAIMSLLGMIAQRHWREYQLTASLNCAADMISMDIRKARMHVFTCAEPCRIDFEPRTASYVFNGVSRVILPRGIRFGVAPGVTGRPSEPHEAPPRDGISFCGEGTENRAIFLPKGLAIPTGAVYLTNGRETMAITVALSGHLAVWRSKGGKKWIEI